MTDKHDADLMVLTGEVVASYAASSKIGAGELIALIASVHGAFARLKDGPPAEPPKALVPAVPVKKSVTPDYIVCLEDGKSFKSLKRHLRTAYGLTPVEYRAKWGLPPDYPMVAENYAAQRSALAKASGLGQARAKAAAKPAAKKGRKPKAAKA